MQWIESSELNINFFLIWGRGVYPIINQWAMGYWQRKEYVKVICFIPLLLVQIRSNPWVPSRINSAKKFTPSIYWLAIPTKLVNDVYSKWQHILDIFLLLKDMSQYLCWYIVKQVKKYLFYTCKDFFWPFPINIWTMILWILKICSWILILSFIHFNRRRHPFLIAFFIIPK